MANAIHRSVDRSIVETVKWLKSLGYAGRWRSDCNGTPYYWVSSRLLVIGVFSEGYFRKGIAGKLVAESAKTFVNDKIEQVYYRSPIPRDPESRAIVAKDFKLLSTKEHEAKAKCFQVWDKCPALLDEPLNSTSPNIMVCKKQ